MNEDAIADLVAKVLNSIESGELNEKGLLATYQNTMAHSGITEQQREKLIEAVVVRLRRDFPRRAKRLFGALDQNARNLLQNLLDRTITLTDHSDNQVMTKVKTGGDVIAGKFAVDVYLSFKNRDTLSTSIEVRQLTAQTDPYVFVRLRHVGTSTIIDEQRFELSDFDSAAALYSKRLMEIAA